MADRPDPPPRRRAPRSGGGWLVLFLLLAGVAAVFVFAPQIPRQLFAAANRPEDGSPPVAPQPSETDLKAREHETAARLGEVSTVDRTAKPEVKAPVIAKPAVPAKLPQFKDQTQAERAIADAEKAYQAFQWQQAIYAARQVGHLDAKPETKVRALDIVRGAEALDRLFTELKDDRDELQRNYDTSPGLVTIASPSGTTYAVPIRSMEDPTVIEESPVEWLESQRRTGKITVKLQGKKDFMPALLTADQVGEIRKADLATIMRDKQADFTRRLERLRNGSEANNALAWYEAAKFAYRNRLDEKVTEMMDRAIVLDPFLVRSVREDKAQTLLASVMLHMKNGNTKQAAAFMAIINKKFADTQNGKTAKLFYEGKTQELFAAAKEAESKRRQEELERKQARKERAQALGDAKAVEQIEREPDPAPERPAAPATSTSAAPSPAATGDEAKADEYFEKGRALYTQAQESGNTSARDSLYIQSLDFFVKAMDIYNVLLEKNPSASLQEKAVMCNQLKFGARKQARFH